MGKKKSVSDITNLNDDVIVKSPHLLSPTGEDNSFNFSIAVSRPIPFDTILF